MTTTKDSIADEFLFRFAIMARRFFTALTCQLATGARRKESRAGVAERPRDSGSNFQMGWCGTAPEPSGWRWRAGPVGTAFEGTEGLLGC